MQECIGAFSVHSDAGADLDIQTLDHRVRVRAGIMTGVQVRTRVEVRVTAGGLVLSDFALAICYDQACHLPVVILQGVKLSVRARRRWGAIQMQTLGPTPGLDPELTLRHNVALDPIVTIILTVI